MIFVTHDCGSTWKCTYQTESQLPTEVCAPNQWVLIKQKPNPVAFMKLTGRYAFEFRAPVGCNESSNFATMMDDEPVEMSDWPDHGI